MSWILPLCFRRPRVLSSVRSWPSKMIEPEFAFSRPTMRRPMVVLPQPDSPTMPNVLPRGTSKLTSATALTLPTRRCMMAPAVTENSLTRCSTFSSAPSAAAPSPATEGAVARTGMAPSAAPASASASAAATVGAPASSAGLSRAASPTGKKQRYSCSGTSPFRSGSVSRHESCAYRHRAANRQPRGGSGQVRRLARNVVQPLSDAGRLHDLVRQRLEQGLRVRVPGVGEQGRRVRRLDDPARVHDRDPVGATGDDPEVVGDQDHRHAEPLAEVVEQFEDLLLDGDVEGGGRLVGDQQLRLAGQRHGDHDPLAHAAGELVREVARSARPAWACRPCRAPRPRAPGRPACRRPGAAGRSPRSGRRSSSSGSATSSGPGRSCPPGCRGRPASPRRRSS